MNTKIKIIVLSASFLCLNASGKICTSVTNNVWQSASTWNTNSVPLSGDTVLIKHTVSSYALLSISNLHVTIDSGAMLCCKSDLDLNNYSYVMNYGIIKESRLHIHTYAHLENKGIVEIYGGYMHIYDLGSAHSTGWIHIYQGYGACCVSTTNYFDNSQQKFSHEIIKSPIVTFNVENVSGLNYKWIFSDGTASGTNVEHRFSSTGYQVVELIEEDSCSTNHYHDTIFIPEIAKLPPLIFNTYYDINSYQLFISVKNPLYENNNVVCEIYDLRGRKLKWATLNLISQNGFKTGIKISDLAPAFYLAKCFYKEYNITKTQKFVFEK